MLLTATDEGRLLYEKLGWTALSAYSTAMRTKGWEPAA